MQPHRVSRTKREMYHVASSLEYDSSFSILPLKINRPSLYVYRISRWFLVLLDVGQSQRTVHVLNRRTGIIVTALRDPVAIIRKDEDGCNIFFTCSDPSMIPYKGSIYLYEDYYCMPPSSSMAGSHESSFGPGDLLRLPRSKVGVSVVSRSFQGPSYVPSCSS